MSFFGGDHSKAHWAIMPEVNHFVYRLPIEERAAARAENKRRRDAMKKHCGKSTIYYEFKVDDKAAKARQKVSADALAKELEQELGFPFEVCEGCFL